MRLKQPIVHQNLVYIIALSALTVISGTRALEACSICSSGDGQVAYPDAIIPSFFLHGDDSVTCSDLEVRASTIPAGSGRCERYQANAGYCGCPEAEQPVNQHCTFCPTGNLPSKPDMMLPMGETCSNLDTYVSYLPESQCTSLQYEAIAKHAYDCGCEISIHEVFHTNASIRQQQNSCSVCPDGSAVPNRKQYLDVVDMTCGAYSDMIGNLNSQECKFTRARGTHELIAYQCGCPNTSPPVCPLQENPELCTVSLLNSVDSTEDCDCYSFCDGEFLGCQNYPGKFLRQQCLGEGISGCNYSSAIDDIGDDNCSLCPDSTNNIANPDFILPSYSGIRIPGSKGRPPTCRDLVDYLQTQKADNRDCDVARNRLAHYCGCQDVEPTCTLCPDGIEPSYRDKMATGDTTCGDFARTVRTWGSETCEQQAGFLSVIAPRCGCISAEMPMCPVQQNPKLCTVNRLRSVTEECECYNFCGDEFHSCANFPGNPLSASQCPEGAIPISGCNMELATSQRCLFGSIGPDCDDEVGETNLRH